MKKYILLVSALLSLGSCGGSNSSAPDIEGLFLSENSVSAGTIETTSVTFWVSATKVDGGVYETAPQSILVNIPVGVSLVPGTSNIGFQGPRDPDAVVTCANGTQSLVYNLAYAEVEDPYNFTDFTSVINFNVLVEAPANQQVAQAAASLTPFVDPCNVPFTTEITYFVSS